MQIGDRTFALFCRADKFVAAMTDHRVLGAADQFQGGGVGIQDVMLLCIHNENTCLNGAKNRLVQIPSFVVHNIRRRDGPAQVVRPAANALSAYNSFSLAKRVYVLEGITHKPRFGASETV